ncbi:MAG: hypothetical protein LIO90_10390 [Bacteroidales bacterium]|nr:hypothetical protein [Bacteroidales bacterium]
MKPTIYIFSTLLVASMAFTSCSSDDTPEYTEEDGIEYIGEASSEWTLSQDYPSWVCENLGGLNKFKFCGENEEEIRESCMLSSLWWVIEFDFYSFELNSKRCLAVEYSTTPVLNGKTFQGTTYFSNDGRVIKGYVVEEAFQKEHKKILSNTMDNLEEVQMEETTVNGHEISSWLNPKLKELTNFLDNSRVKYIHVLYSDEYDYIAITYLCVLQENMLWGDFIVYSLEGEPSSSNGSGIESWITIKEFVSSYTILQMSNS